MQIWSVLVRVVDPGTAHQGGGDYYKERGVIG